jgi:hypothetical protein
MVRRRPAGVAAAPHGDLPGPGPTGAVGPIDGAAGRPYDPPGPSSSWSNQRVGQPLAEPVPSMIADNVNNIREIIGKDSIEALAVGLHPNGNSPSYDRAVAGIDAVLWDLKARIENKRVADVLRPVGALDAVRLSASGGRKYDWRRNHDTLVEAVVGHQKRGFTASNIRSGTRAAGVTPQFATQGGLLPWAYWTPVACGVVLYRRAIPSSPAPTTERSSYRRSSRPTRRGSPPPTRSGKSSVPVLHPKGGTDE